MDAGRWQQIRSVFEAAIAVGPEQRARFLEQACIGDPDLCAEVVRMIEADDDDRFLESPPLAGSTIDHMAPTPAGDDCTRGVIIERYRLIRKIGTGGMGTVWLAERADEQFDKQVALKLIKRGMDTDDVLVRFCNERQVLANLDHPNIARLLDGGATPDGRPFLVMEYVDGIPIDSYCAINNVSVDEVLRLFVTVCSAVHTAHQSLVVHRDLKPGNILVTPQGAPKLLDFGIAKVLDLDESMRTLAKTATDVRLMTPRYASPEQIRGEPITTATDIYSLGVILYELLTCQHPHDTTTGTHSEFERAVCEQEPVRPSSMVSTSGRTSGDDSSTGGSTWPVQQRRGIRRRLVGDVDNIVLKALSKDPVRRYTSAEQLGLDIERHLRGLPINARPDTMRYRTGKFVRRNRVAVTCGITLFVILLAGLIAGWTLYRQTEAARKLARAAQVEAEWQAYASGLAAADAALGEVHRPHEARRYLDSTPADLRGWEWTYLSNRIDRSLWNDRTQGRPMALAVSPDDRMVVVGSGMGSSGYLQWWDMQSGVALATQTVGRTVVDAVAFSADGQLLATGERDGTVRLWDAQRREQLVALTGHDHFVRAAVFSPTAPLLATADSAGSIRLWDTREHTEVAHWTAHEGAVFCLAISDEGTLIASGGDDGMIHTWDLAHHTQVHSLAEHSATVRALAFATGDELVSTGADNLAIRWDLESGSEIGRVAGPREARWTLALSRAGRYAASDAEDNAVRIWDTRTSAIVGSLRGHREASAALFGAVFSAHDSHVFTITWEREVCGWHVSGCPSHRAGSAQGVPAVMGQRVALARSRDGSMLATGGVDQGIRLWDPQTLVVLAAIDSVGCRINDLSFGPDGTWLAGGAEDGTVRLWDTMTGSQRAQWDEGSRVVDVDVSVDGSLIAAVSTRQTVGVRHTATGETVLRIDQAEGAPSCVMFDSRGSVLICAGTARKNTVFSVWDIARAEEQRRFEVPGAVHSLNRTAHNDTIMLAIGPNAAVLNWQTGEMDLVSRPVGAAWAVLGMGMTAQEDRVVTASTEGILRLWDARRQQCVLMLRELMTHERQRDVVFGPNDRWIAAISNGRPDINKAAVIGIWDTAPPSDRVAPEEVMRLLSLTGNHDTIARRVEDNAALTREQKSAALRVLTRVAPGRRVTVPAAQQTPLRQASIVAQRGSFLHNRLVSNPGRP